MKLDFSRSGKASPRLFKLSKAAILILLVLLFGPTSSAAESGPEQCVAAIMAAWNAHDMHAFASQFTEDATFVNVNGW